MALALASSQQRQVLQANTFAALILPAPAISALIVRTALKFGALQPTNDRLRLGTNRSSRTIYVVISGMNDPESEGAQMIGSRLVENGVPKEHVLIPSNPCPSFSKDAAENFRRYGIGLDNPTISLFKKNLELYANYTNPQSEESQCSYQEMSRLVAGADFMPQRGDRLVLIGHSLGGQRAVTIAELAEANGLPVHNLITLGTPLIHNNCYKTKITHITSDGDAVMAGIAPLPAVSVSQSIEARVLKTPEHVDHRGYYTDQSVFNSIVVNALLEPSGPSSSWSDFDGVKQAIKVVQDDLTASNADGSRKSRIAGAVASHTKALGASLQDLGRGLMRYRASAAGNN